MSAEWFLPGARLEARRGELSKAIAECITETSGADRGRVRRFQGQDRARFAAPSTPARPAKPSNFKASTGLKSGKGSIGPLPRGRTEHVVMVDDDAFERVLLERDFSASGGRFDASKHPRGGKGSQQGGKFVKGHGTAKAAVPPAKGKPQAKSAPAANRLWGTVPLKLLKTATATMDRPRKDAFKTSSKPVPAGKPQAKGQKPAAGKPAPGKKPAPKMAKPGQPPTAKGQKPAKPATPPASKTPTMDPNTATTWAPEHDADFRQTAAQILQSPKVPPGAKNLIAQLAGEYRADFEGGKLQGAPAAQPPAAGAPPAPQAQQPPSRPAPSTQGAQQPPAAQPPPAKPQAPQPSAQQMRPNPDLDAIMGGQPEQPPQAAPAEQPATPATPAPGAGRGSDAPEARQAYPVGDQAAIQPSEPSRPSEGWRDGADGADGADGQKQPLNHPGGDRSSLGSPNTGHAVVQRSLQVEELLQRRTGWTFSGDGPLAGLRRRAGAPHRPEEPDGATTAVPCPASWSIAKGGDRHHRAGPPSAPDHTVRDCGPPSGAASRTTTRWASPGRTWTGRSGGDRCPLPPGARCRHPAEHRGARRRTTRGGPSHPLAQRGGQMAIGVEDFPPAFRCGCQPFSALVSPQSPAEREVP